MPRANVETLAAGFMGESPRWHDDRLWLADWGSQEIVAVDADGKSETILTAPSFPFCFDWLPDGRLLVVSGREGLILRQEPDGSLVTHADLTGLSPHPWKDIVVDGQGNAYVGNIGFDFPEGDFAPGIIAVVTPDGTARQAARGVAFPHGLAITPDGGTLIVAEAYANKLTAFGLAAKGGLSKRRIWAKLRYGVPHGICVDEQGAVWYADLPNEECVRVGEGGEVLETIDAGQSCFACALGGADGRTLFMMTADWNGAASMREGAETGLVLRVTAPAARAGRP